MSLIGGKRDRDEAGAFGYCQLQRNVFGLLLHHSSAPSVLSEKKLEDAAEGRAGEEVT